MPIQTELYLEELSDRVEEADVDVQTDAFLDRPPSPLFVPAKTGMDVETQIYEGDVSATHHPHHHHIYIVVCLCLILIFTSFVLLVVLL